jgi:hypothetical protein
MLILSFVKIQMNEKKKENYSEKRKNAVSN